MFFLHNAWVPSVGQFWAWGRREADEKPTILGGAYSHFWTINWLCMTR